MKRYVSFAVVGLSWMALTACQSGKAGLSQQDEAAIRQQGANLVKIFTSEKPDWNAAVDAHYAEDAKVLLPNAPAAEGRAAIKAAFAQFPPMKEFRWDVVSLEGRGDLAYEHGTYLMTTAAAGGLASVTDKGKGIVVHKKQADGTWRIIRDIWNSDSPGLVVPAGALKTDAGPELKQLASFVGQWKMEGEAKAGPAGPAGKYALTMNCQWFPGGGQLVCGAEGTGPQGPYQELAVLGYDSGSKAYTQFSMNNTGSGMMGKGSLQSGKLTYAFDARAEGKPLKVRFTLFDNSASGWKWKSEVSLAGGPWTLADEGQATKKEGL
jgi:ketosteroid isomerase-like protein